ncbi:hypothetical protein BH11MYX2_BH11MYX2_33030 [soil metagenome]
MATLGAFLAQHRATVERTRGNATAHALAAVERAEAEPVFGYRAPDVRAAIEAAALALDKDDRPELKARLMVKLAQQKMVEQDYDSADRALARVGELVPTQTAIRFLVGVRACRVAIRRGPEQRTQARDLLLVSAGRLPSLQSDDSIWQHATAELAIAMAEGDMHDPEPRPAAYDTLTALVDELGADPAFADTMFTARQLLVAYAISVGDDNAAVSNARALVELATGAAAFTDEVEARLTLAALLSNGDLVQKQEAAHHAQRARDRALEHGLSQHYQAALIAQAGVLSDAGKTAGAIDRMLELARLAADEQSLPRYVEAVAMMSALYTKSGDVASAFRTVAEANHALSTQLNKDTTEMFAPILRLLRDQVGSERLQQIAADVGRSNQLASELASRERSDSE